MHAPVAPPEKIAPPLKRKSLPEWAGSFLSEAKNLCIPEGSKMYGFFASLRMIVLSLQQSEECHKSIPLRR